MCGCHGCKQRQVTAAALATGLLLLVVTKQQWLPTDSQHISTAATSTHLFPPPKRVLLTWWSTSLSWAASGVRACWAQGRAPTPTLTSTTQCSTCTHPCATQSPTQICCHRWVVCGGIQAEVFLGWACWSHQGAVKGRCMLGCREKEVYGRHTSSSSSQPAPVWTRAWVLPPKLLLPKLPTTRFTTRLPLLHHSPPPRRCLRRLLRLLLSLSSCPPALRRSAKLCWQRHR